jgi:hypothetical protein
VPCAKLSFNSLYLLIKVLKIDPVLWHMTQLGYKILQELCNLIDDSAHLCWDVMIGVLRVINHWIRSMQMSIRTAFLIPYTTSRQGT